MKKLEKAPLIDSAALSQRQYFRSLLIQCQAKGILFAGELSVVQQQSASLLAMLCGRFTGGESSSVTVERAQSLALSLFYTIGVYLKSLPSADSAAEALKKESLETLFHLGQERIKEGIARAGTLHKRVKALRVGTGNLAYNDTLDAGLGLFFSSYDYEFAAHETPGMMDYPLCRAELDVSFSGIEFIWAYLKALDIETRFCRLFPPDEVSLLMEGSDELLQNIFEYVFENALGRALCGLSLKSLVLEDCHIKALYKRLSPLSESAVRVLLSRTAQRVCASLSPRFEGAGELCSYCLFAAARLSPRLSHSLSCGAPALFFKPLQKSAPPAASFTDGARMSDSAFRTLCQRVFACEDFAEKRSLLLREVHSLTDLSDLLESDCLSSLQVRQLVRSLDDTTRAILLRLSPHLAD